MKNYRSRFIATVFCALCVSALFAFGCVMTPGAKTSKEATYVGEPRLMLTLGNYGATFDAPGYPIVYPSELLNIKTYRDPGLSLANFTTYDFDYTNKTNPLLEKELFGQLEKAMQANGLTRDTKNPQVLISMDFYIGKKEQYTPPTTVTSTKIETVWNTALWGWGGYSQAVPVTSSSTTPGYTTTSYYKNIRLNFLDRSKLKKGAKLEVPPMIWMGEIDNEGADSDIRGISIVMFNELMKEFPQPTNMEPKRFVRLFRYGGLGLGFAENDWRTVRYVEPGSVAEQNGIKPGDQLLTINGRKVDTFLPRSLWYIPNSNNYREKDTYYLNVLSNRGDKEVEVVVKPAYSSEKISHKLTPKGGDRYIYVDQYGSPILK